MAHYGASPEAWAHFSSTLGLTTDLLPVVSNPHAVIAERSTLKSIGKTPSVYDARGEVVGLGKWTSRIATPADIARWSAQPDYSISQQTRNTRAIDADLGDPAKAATVNAIITTTLGGLALPKRYRENSGKFLLTFRYDGPMPKRVIPVDGGIIEFLGDGQQFVAYGQHASGVPYLWDSASGLPGEPPTLSEEELENLYATLVALLATSEPTIARQRREPTGVDLGTTTDDVAQWLVEHWDVYDSGSRGELFLRCPFEAEHTSDSGETATAYFVAGSGGYARGHWKCLHAHCAAREDHDFLKACGYIGSSFEALPELPCDPYEASRAPTFELVPTEDLDLPTLDRTRDGKIEANAANLVTILGLPRFTGMRLAEDVFRAAIVWSPASLDVPQWREFCDTDYVSMEISLHRRGVKPVAHEALRRWIAKAAGNNQIDTAREWVSRLRWDGVPRVADFAERYLGAEAGLYATAVSRYLWSAMPGRVISPGCQADMVPILYGAQGARKSSAIQALVPDPDFYVALDLGTRDDDTARLMRGTLVGELDELRGLKSRDAESIKSWITRRGDKWVPKYKEFSSTYLRRIVLIGSTNRDDILADETGERRWLPLAVATHGPIDVNAIARDREQLWAEGAVLYGLDGIEWSDAERLARDVHVDYKVDDAWTEVVEAWLDEPNMVGATPRGRVDGLTAAEVLVGALGIPPRDADHGRKLRVGRVLRSLGYEQQRVGKARDRRWFPSGS